MLADTVKDRPEGGCSGLGWGVGVKKKKTLLLSCRLRYFYLCNSVFKSNTCNALQSTWMVYYVYLAKGRLVIVLEGCETEVLAISFPQRLPSTPCNHSQLDVENLFFLHT